MCMVLLEKRMIDVTMKQSLKEGKKMTSKQQVLVTVITAVVAFSLTQGISNGMNENKKERQYYIIRKVNTATNFLKPGETLAGYVEDCVCGAKIHCIGRNEKCAVISSEELEPDCREGVNTPKTKILYYIEEVYATGTPALNLAGFIEGSRKKGRGIGGDKVLGVFKVNNY